MRDVVDTIAALATPIGGSSVAIVRTSGPRAIAISDAILTAKISFSSPSPGTPGVGRGEGPSSVDERLIKDGPHPNPLPGYRERGLRLSGIEVPARVLSFVGPRSSTGEDVVEYHLPASPWIVTQLLERLTALGARQAEPGEFTSRAFLNRKIDLAAAEGVVATISASNRAGLDAGRQLLAGELARRLVPVMDRLSEALALVELGIDFSEEDVSFLERSRLVDLIESSKSELAALLAAAPSLERLVHEPRIVLAGRPNAGKSSLLNALAGRPRAIVTDQAGTTRDVLTERIALSGGYVTIADVAGLDDHSPSGMIDEQMRATSLRAIAEADRVVLVHATDDANPPLVLTRTPDLIVRSKSDLDAHDTPADAVPASTLKPNGLQLLRTALDRIAFPPAAGESAGSVALNARHRSALTDAAAALADAAERVDHGAEIVAAELRRAIDDLGRVLGRVAPDDVLGRIFSSFCIGK